MFDVTSSFIHDGNDALIYGNCCVYKKRQCKGKQDEKYSCYFSNTSNNNNISFDICYGKKKKMRVAIDISFLRDADDKATWNT